MKSNDNLVGMTERIKTLHPEGKKGVNIEKAKYDKMKKAIISSLKGVESISFKNLGQVVRERLTKDFEGSIGWYYTTVKLDLEARGIIERVPNTRPQLLRLA